MTEQHQTHYEKSKLFSYLIELRARLLRCFFVIFILFAFFSLFANDIYHFIAFPLIKNLPDNSSMIATSVIAPFFVPLKLALFLSIFIAMPFIFYQTWFFIAPALYKHEKNFIAPFLISSTVLFYLGILFAYYVVFPIMFNFIANTVPLDVKLATDIGNYLDFVLKLFFAFGICFEVPVIIVLLCTTGLCSIHGLTSKRSYIIILAFIIGMLLSPPDVISQTLLAIPICILFEVGILISKLLLRKKTATENK